MSVTYRTQKHLTITEEQAEFIKSKRTNGDGQLSISQLSTMLGLSKNVIYNNMKVLKLTKHPQVKIPKPRYKIIDQVECKIVNFDRNGYFDVDQFQKYYNY